MMLSYHIIDPIITAFHWEYLADLNIVSILFRLILAVLCGGILGFERAKNITQPVFGLTSSFVWDRPSP